MNTCCDAMKHAIEEGYLYQPFLMIRETIDGQKRMNLRAGAPSIKGPAMAHSRKHKPILMITYCPWCRKLLKNNDGTAKDIDTSKSTKRVK